jgi:hypothetical protein
MYVRPCPGLRPRRIGAALTVTGYTMLPSARWDRVGIRELHAYFGAQYWAWTYPCQRFGGTVTVTTA